MFKNEQKNDPFQGTDHKTRHTKPVSFDLDTSIIAQFDSEVAGKFLNYLYKNTNGYMTISYKHHKDKSDNFPTKRFHTNDLKNILSFCSKNVDKNLWFSVGILGDEGNGGRGVADETKYIPGLWLDFDCKEGYPADEQEGKPSRKEVINMLSTLPLKPSIIVNSGGGLHPYWLFNKPLLVTKESEDLPKTFVDVINDYTIAVKQMRFSDSVGDLARVMRLPGGFNYKRGKVRPSTIEVNNDVRYTLKDIEGLINHIKQETKKYEKPKDKKQLSSAGSKTTLSDKDVWDKLYSSRSGAMVRDIYNGDIHSELIPEKVRGDNSRVDWLLAKEIALVVGNDPDRIESLMRQTQLERKKWDEHRTYLSDLTIPKAIKEAEEELERRKDYGKLTQSQKLYEIAKDNKYFHTPEGLTYTQIDMGNHYQNLRVNSERFKNWLRLKFHQREGKTPGNQAVQDTVNQLTAYAQFDPSLKEDIHLRLAGDFNKIYIDLVNDDWETVKITKNGWDITRKPSVNFKREKAILPLPKPVKGGSINELRRFINVTDEEWPLLVAYLISAYHPKGPYPILVMQGEQGSAKSTSTRILKDLIDPAVADIRAMPKDEEGVAVAGNHSWCVAFDNLSGLSNYLADVLCRMSTGGAITGRALYSNDEEHIFSLKRPVILNGIDDIVSRGDLGDRSIVINLPSILEEDRKEESLLWKEFKEAKPRILGAVFDVISKTLNNLPHVQLDGMPRMADFAKWAVAAEQACGLSKGEFMKVYDRNRKETAEGNIGNDLVAMGIVNIMTLTSEWQGNSTRLLEALKGVLPDRAKLPAVNRLRSRIERARPLLRHKGIEITQNARRVYTIEKVNGRPPHTESSTADEPTVPTQEIDKPRVEGWSLEDDGTYTKDLSEEVQAVMELKNNGLVRLGVRYWKDGIQITKGADRQDVIKENITKDSAIQLIKENRDAIVENMSQELILM